jgi:hypothetical protein
MPGFLRSFLGKVLAPRRSCKPDLEELKEVLGDDLDDLSWLEPPERTDDPDAWNEYWRAQLSHPISLAFQDLFCQDDDLLRVMKMNGLRRLLCAGSGISLEPRALAEAGCEVTALDFSSVAMQAAEAMRLTDEGFKNYLDPTARQEDGSLHFVTGSIFDEETCPGPYDVIIERRTIQTLPEEERHAALEALAGRMGDTGILLSHYHEGWWRPGQELIHPAERWFREHGWTILEGRELGKVEVRVAWLMITTG